MYNLWFQIESYSHFIDTDFKTPDLITRTHENV
jgi:hypothetical protein